MAGPRLSSCRSMYLTASTTARSGSTRLTAFPPTTSASLRSNGLIRNACLFVHQASDARSPVYFGAALAAATQASFNLQSIDSEKSADIDPAKYAFVVLSDAMALPSIFENALLRYVRDGGNVLIATGTSAAHHARIPIFGGSSSDAHTYSRDGYATVGQTDLDPPVMNECRWMGRFEFLLRRSGRSGPGAGDRAAHRPHAAADGKTNRRGPRASVCLRTGQPDQRSAGSSRICTVC